jgi:ADP-heptose:LPS heptosyltransferase
MKNASYIAAARRNAARFLSRSVTELTSASATAVWIRPLIWIRSRPPLDRRSRIEGTYNILVVRVDGVGDMIMTGPFLRELRRAFPDARITLIVAPEASNLVETCPHVDRILTLRLPPATIVRQPLRWWHPLWRRIGALSFARRHLWPESYDLAIVPRWAEDPYEATVLTYLSGAPRRVGYSEDTSADKQAKNRGYDRFFTEVVDDRSVKHEVQRNLDLLSVLGVAPSDDRLEAWLSKEDENFAVEILGSAGAKTLVALGPGAGSARRMWPIERFVETGRWFADRGFRLLIVGGPGEEALGAELHRHLGSDVIDLTGRATLRQTAALLRRCILFCGNDAGPMHLAAAVGIRVVEISCHSLEGDDLHLNSPKRFGPWGVPHRIVRPEDPAEGCVSGCQQPTPHCILNVGVSSVMAAIKSLMDETAVLGRSVDAS